MEPNPQIHQEQGFHYLILYGRHAHTLIRDPYEATAYEMTEQEFVKYWNGVSAAITYVSIFS